MKKIIKFILYKILYFFPQATLIKYSQGFFDKKNSSLFTTIIRGYLGECYKKGETEEQKELGYDLWRSRAATDYLGKRAVPDSLVNKFRDVIINNSEYDVYEIGTGNGYLIKSLSEKIPGRKFIGIDLNAEQIIDNKNNIISNSINFVCEDAIKYVKKAVFEKAIFVSYVTFTTFTPDSVSSFFESISHKGHPAVIAICEANRPGVAESESSELRGNLAYSHNYITLAKKHGFDIIETSFSEQGQLFWLVCFAPGNNK